MAKRSSSVVLIAVVAVVVLVLGSFGTATAAGLTRSTVKKIAAKVVKKQAPSLSVANAANAANADRLDGLDSTALTTSSTSASVTTGGPFPGAKDWSFTVPAGTFLFNYHAGIAPASNNVQVLCYLSLSSAPSQTFATEMSNYSSPFSATWLSGSAVRTLASNTTVTLHCETAGFASFSVASVGGVQVSWTKLTGSSVGTLTKDVDAGSRQTQ